MIRLSLFSSTLLAALALPLVASADLSGIPAVDQHARQNERISFLIAGPTIEGASPHVSFFVDTTIPEGKLREVDGLKIHDRSIQGGEYKDLDERKPLSRNTVLVTIPRAARSQLVALLEGMNTDHRQVAKWRQTPSNEPFSMQEAPKVMVKRPLKRREDHVPVSDVYDVTKDFTRTAQHEDKVVILPKGETRFDTKTKYGHATVKFDERRWSNSSLPTLVSHQLKRLRSFIRARHP